MQTLIENVLPIFALVMLGYIAGKTGGFSMSAAQGLSRFLGIYALPALLFETMVTAQIPENIEWGFVGAFFISAFANFTLSFFLWRRSLPQRGLAAVSFASGFSNMGAIGVPLFVAAYGPAAAVPLLVLMVFNSPLLFTTATFFA